MSDWERQAALALWFGMLGAVAAVISAGVLAGFHWLRRYDSVR